MNRRMLNVLLSVTLTLLLTAPAAAVRSAGHVEGWYDVGGYRLWITCAGPHTQNAAVILAGGLTRGSATWDTVFPALTRTSRACVYDRSGVNLSDQGPLQANGYAGGVRELRALLGRVNERGPYVLVGLEYGAEIMRYYAQQHPQEVAGMVLIDGGVLRRELLARYRAALPQMQANEPLVVTHLRRDVRGHDPGFPSTEDEFNRLPFQGVLGGKPLAVVTAGRSEWTETAKAYGGRQDLAKLETARRRAYRALLGMSSNAKHVIAPHRTAGLVGWPQEDLRLTLSVIRAVLDSARSGTNLK
ncbi:alpha/beta fold hydrolase [Deinococcus peraridilitoris]|uniref:Putative hydrolase or acyltransferase of alpha/beta superfamily n=1 Tax=Deinococcus peraridilitoris (strain DSM 19664 / LMG 22246 / CIP 109416 / KR-200) TaxID=937777 RepID=L0A078_DEIPD|nr:alpha/beta hydrolase [Deinococcus peraridilitoris]AFZ67241.1 putative hydrolase or acyltransferase of alpha/beta superfamily [Deinococcus peraridilitoris DSM 19664]